MASVPSRTRFSKSWSSSVTNWVLMLSVMRHFPFSRNETSSACTMIWTVSSVCSVLSGSYPDIMSASSEFTVSLLVPDSNCTRSTPSFNAGAMASLTAPTSSELFNASTDAARSVIRVPSENAISTSARPFSSVPASLVVTTVTWFAAFFATFITPKKMPIRPDAFRTELTGVPFRKSLASLARWTSRSTAKEPSRVAFTLRLTRASGSTSFCRASNALAIASNAGASCFTSISCERMAGPS